MALLRQKSFFGTETPETQKLYYVLSIFGTETPKSYYVLSIFGAETPKLYYVLSIFETPQFSKKPLI